MASVAQHLETAAWVDRSLDLLTSEWTAIPEVAAAWTEWNDEDRLDVVLEWPLREDRLRPLREWNAEGRRTEPQRLRFVALLALIGEHQDTLTGLPTG